MVSNFQTWLSNLGFSPNQLNTKQKNSLAVVFRTLQDAQRKQRARAAATGQGRDFASWKFAHVRGGKLDGVAEPELRKMWLCDLATVPATFSWGGPRIHLTPTKPTIKAVDG
jgi:hypothetical protein